MENLLSPLSHIGAELLVGAVFLLASYAVALLKRKVGVDLEAQLRATEARHRQALHDAIETRLRAGIARGLPDTELPAWVEALVRRALPDAIGALKPGEGVLRDLIEAKQSLINSKSPEK